MLACYDATKEKCRTCALVIPDGKCQPDAKTQDEKETLLKNNLTKK